MKKVKFEKSLIKRLLKDHVSPYAGRLVLATVCMAISAVATAAFPYFLKPAFDFIFSDGNKTDLIFFCFCILASFLVKGASAYGESVIMLSVGQKIVFDMQERLFKHLLRADLRFFHETHSGDLLSRFSNDTSLMRNSISTIFASIGKDFLTFVLLCTLMFYRDSVLASFAFIVFPTAVIPIFLIGRKMMKVTEKTQGDIGSLSVYLSQIFQGIRIVKAYNAYKLEESRIKSKIDGLYKLIIKSARIKSALHPISECIGGLAIIFVLGHGGVQVMNDQKTAGDLVSFVGAIILSYEPLKRLTHLSANIQEGLAAAKRIYSSLDIAPAIKNSKNTIVLTKDINSVEFKNVCFSYGDYGRDTISNINFAVKNGQTVAFVGKSGSGKSTILNLIPRFYDVSSGEILINGHNIKDLEIESLRNQIAIVTQETILFDASFYDNIAYGGKDAAHEDILTAAKSANADEFIVRTVDGYDTMIGENGLRISGGQRQRISIARAMLKNAPILLLDEATSSLDTNSERAVQTALEKLMKNRTTFIVAHRLSSIVNSDVIHVIDNGKIVESGTHSELLQTQDGLYSMLWRAQDSEFSSYLG